MKFIKILFTLLLCLVFKSSMAQVGINTIMPLSTLDINGNLSIKTIGIPIAFIGGSSGNAKAIVDGVYISLTPVATSGITGQEFILPNALTYPGRTYILRNISNSVNALIYTFGGALFAKDASTLTPLPLILPFNASLKTVIVISDGANWTYIF